MPRRFILTDIHGCAESLNALIEKFHPVEGDELYFLGDYINHGPSSKQVIDTIINLRAKGFLVRTIKGNHEEYFLNALEGKNYNEWLEEHGGMRTLESFEVDDIKNIPSQYIEFFRSLEYFIELDKCFLVHAGFNFEIADPFTDKAAMLQIRGYHIRPELLKGKKLIHGHTPTKIAQIMQSVENNGAEDICLDGGCIYNNEEEMGHLIALELESWRLFVQDCIDIIEKPVD